MKIKFLKLFIILSITILFTQTVVPSKTQASGSAGVYASITVPNYKIDVLNLHYGYAGPSVGNATHTNVRVYKWNGSSFVLRRNYHVSARTSGLSVCWNIWDSKTNKEYNNCHSGYSKSSAITAMQDKLVSLIKEYTQNQITQQAILIIVGLVTISWVIWPTTKINLN